MLLRTTLALTLLIGAQAQAAKPKLNVSNTEVRTVLPSCDKSISISSANRVEVPAGIKSIPQGHRLVAREAHFFIESRTDNGGLARIGSYQSFTNLKKPSKSKIICGTSEAPLKNRFSMMAPTVIDNRSRSQAKNIYWQFQVMAENTNLTAWNTVSIALPSSDDIEKTIRRLGIEPKVYQLSHNRYEIVYEQKSPGHEQVLTVTYDLD